MRNKMTFAVLLAILAVFTANSAQAQYYRDVEDVSVVGGVLNTASQSRTLQGAIIGGALGKILGGRTGVFKNSDEGAALGVLVGGAYGAYRDNKAHKRAKLETLCRAGYAPPQECMKLLPKQDRERFESDSRHRPAEDADRYARRDRDDSRRSDSGRDDRYEPRRSQQSFDDDYLINNAKCNLVVDGQIVEPGRGTRFSHQRSRVMKEGSDEQLNLIWSNRDEAFFPLSPRS